MAKDKKTPKGLVIDGVIGSEAIDSSGEILVVEGVDLSSLETEDGIPLNYEHRSSKDEGASYNDIIGRCISAKKIYKREDCANDRERMYWDRVKVPFIYGVFELFDAEGHPNAVAAAAIIRHYHRRNLPITIRYSIEGSTLKKEGNRLVKTVCRAVASTIKPCNKTAFSGVLEDPQEESGEEEDILATLKFEHPERQKISNVELDLNPLLEDAQMTKEEAAAKLAEMVYLSKTLTAGNYNAAPSTLTGGAALAREDRGIGFYKAQFLAAVRDWDRTGSFRDFLKSRMPECDDEYIDYFVDLVDDYTVKKARELEANLAKTMSETARLKQIEQKLRKAAESLKPQPQPHYFRGQYVTPGEVEFVSGVHKGTRLPLIHKDYNYAYLINDTGQLQKLGSHLEGRVFRINTPPKRVHVPTMIETPFGAFDLDGETEYAPVGAKPGQTHRAGWYRTDKGNRIFVKPALAPKRHGLPAMHNAYSSARREALFHDMAHDFFGLGAYVPATTYFVHPEGEPEYSAQLEVVGGTHPQMIFRGNRYIPKRGTPTSLEIERLGDQGVLHRLALLDYIMGNSDRSINNYMLTPEQGPGIHLIDNSDILADTDGYVPAYLEHYEALKGIDPRAPAHPSAVEMAARIDPRALGVALAEHGVPPSLVQNAVRRAAYAHAWAKKGSSPSISDLIRRSKR